MPQLQVLQREEDPTQNQVVASMENMRKAMAEAKQAKLYEFQLKAMARNADNDEKKMDYTRKAQFVQDAMKLKEMGAGDKAVELLHSLYGDDTFPYAQEFGSELAKAAGSAADQEKLGAAQLDKAIAFKLGGGMSQGGEQRSLPMQVGVGMDGQPDAAPMTKPMSKGDAAAEGGKDDVLVTKITRHGVEMVFPRDAAAEVTNTTRAKNLEDLKSGPLTNDQVKAGVYAESIVTDVGDAISFLNANPKLNDAQKGAVDSENPKLAGQDVEGLQGALNNARSVLLYLRSGAAVNQDEYNRLRNLTMLQGKSTANAIKDLQRFERDSSRYLDLMGRGRAGLSQPNEQDVFRVGDFVIKRKGSK
jgi:hypothetical protein